MARLALAVLGLPGLDSGHAQLAITEVMSLSATSAGWSGRYGITNGSDFFELTNFGTNTVDLDRYRYADNMDSPRELLAPPGSPQLLIQPGESVVFVRSRETTNEAQFRAWWGAGVPSRIKIRMCPETPGFDSHSDGVRLYDRAGALVDHVEFGVARAGVTWTYDPATGEFGAYSVPGECGAFVAEMAGDIGSPGSTCGPVPLQILQQPTDQQVCAGLDVTLTARAGGLPKPRFQWLLNGSAIPGAVSERLNLTNVQPAQAGVYEVQIENGFAALRSATARLTVDLEPSAPKLVTPPWDWTVIIGQTARFSVSVCAFPLPSYQWSANGIVLPGATNRTLVLPNCTLEMSGTRYAVHVQNELGATSASAQLIVTPGPRLEITEIMPRASGDWPEHKDWFELSNLDTYPLNLLGYRFSDRFVQETARVVTQPVILRPGESAVFVEQMSPEAFRRWWGEENLPPELQIVPYVGMGLNEQGEALYLWNAAAEPGDDPVDARSFAPPAPNASLRFDAQDCYFGCDSDEGQFGAFRAAEGRDVASPGYTTNPPPRLVSITRDEAGATLRWRAIRGRGYRVRYRPDLTEPGWTTLLSVTATGSVATAYDSTVGQVLQRFYQIEELP